MLARGVRQRPKGAVLHTDIPTRADLEQLLSARDAASVSIYLPTTPEEGGKRDRLEFKRLGAEALEQQLAGTQRIRRIVLDLSDASGVPPRTMTMLRGALRRVLRGGASLTIIGANAPVRSAIESCALEDVEFHRTASTALPGRPPAGGGSATSARGGPSAR